MDHLFSNPSVSGHLEYIKNNLVKSINRLESPDFLQGIDFLCLLLVSKWKVNLLCLKEPIKKDCGEFNKSGDDYMISSQYGVLKNNTKILLVKVPFEGDGDFLKLRPSRFKSVLPLGYADKDFIYIYFTFQPDENIENFQREVKNNLELIKEYVGFMNKDIEDFNNQLENLIRGNLIVRKNNLNKFKEAFDSLGFTEEIGGKTKEIFFEKPTEKIQIEIETNKSEEPVLSEAIFQSITETINRIGKSFEKTSSELRNLQEEQIRDVFLSCLQVSYGNLSITGESFNRKGKTDILIKHNGSNLYISEFKIWKDEPTIIEGINQLLGNLTWTDSKCSYVILCRNKGFISLVSKIKNLITSHPMCSALVSDINEYSFRFKFKNPLDEDNLINLNVHLLNIS